jgi:hypothetical protein
MEPLHLAYILMKAYSGSSGSADIFMPLQLKFVGTEHENGKYNQKKGYYDTYCLT